MYNKGEDEFFLNSTKYCGDVNLALRYSISYLETQSSGFSFFGFRRSSRKVKCDKCNFNHAIMSITENDNPSNKINLCTVCYNEYSVEELLTESKARMSS